MNQTLTDPNATYVQAKRQNEDLQTNINATQGYSITPNQGSNVPYIFQTQQLLENAQAAYNKIPKVNPPSEEEISHQMWMSSGLMALVFTLVTGSAEAGIAGGMSAALAVHDHGYDLRQRGEYIMELHNKGFSAPAILSWYQTGDNKELDKEADRMQKMADRQVDIDERQADRDQQREFHKDQVNTQWSIAKLHEAGANARAEMQALATKGATNKQEQIAQREAMNTWGGMLKTMQGNNNKENQAYQKFKGAIAQNSKLGDESAVLSYMIAEAPNVSPRLNQVHFMTDAARNGVLDWAQQALTKASQGGLLTPAERHDLTVIIDNVHQAQDDAYKQAVAGGLSGIDLNDPEEARKAVFYTNMTIPELRKIQASTNPDTGEYTPPKKETTQQDNSTKSTEKSTTSGDYSSLWGGK
ncbi:hypothetical protein LSB85_003678 [Salmonella enterica]|nr:hypothetical protein [Salmonella enterica]